MGKILTNNINGENRVVYACSGCADVGEIADQVARRLRKDGFATPKASCLAGIAAELKPFIDAAKSAKEVVTIDGCSVFCAKKILENKGLNPVSILLTEMGCEKGNTPCTSERITSIVERIKTNNLSD